MKFNDIKDGMKVRFLKNYTSGKGCIKKGEICTLKRDNILYMGSYNIYRNGSKTVWSISFDSHAEEVEPAVQTLKELIQ